MPQWRKLHLKATESLDINDMPDDFTRLLWVMLPLGLDREGRGLDNPSWVKSKIMPLRIDVTIDMIATAMDWFEQRGMLERYEVEGRKYFWVPSFARYQGSTSREADSDCPPPPVATNSRPTHDPLVQRSSTEVDVEVDSDVEVDVDASDNNLPPISAYSAAFVNRSHVPERQAPRWIEALKKIRNNQRATIPEMEQAIDQLHEKNFQISGPWSIINAVGIVLSQKARAPTNNGSNPEPPLSPGLTKEQLRAAPRIDVNNL